VCLCICALCFRARLRSRRNCDARGGYARTCTCVLRFQMLDPSVLTDLEELTLCGCCKQKYNDVEQCPKYLSCKHYFCLRCIESNLLKGRDLQCAHCWKTTDLGNQGADALPTHSALLALANNLSRLKITTNNTSGKPDKERKVTIDHSTLFERDPLS